MKLNFNVNNKKYLIICLLFVILLSSSCAVRKNVVYFQETTNVQLDSTKNYEIKIKSGDLLSVDIYGVEDEFKSLFTQFSSSTGQPPNYLNGVAAKTGYQVDNTGNITLPIVGSVSVKGKTITEANKIITEKIQAISNDAQVLLRLQNFKVTVLGDVRNPGTFNIPNERISIIEAIGIAGDLNITGERKNVLIVRDIDGQKKEYRIDLTKSEVFNSDIFYLSQNDIVYVEPNKAKRNSSLVGSAAGIFISVASLIITTINAITK